jgi:ABC-type transporter Mla subunit MlaD
MTEDLFRIVVTVAVALACVAFLVQAIVAIALYRVATRMQKKVFPLVDQMHAVAVDAVPVFQRAGPVIERVGPVIDRVGPALDSAIKVLTATQQIVEETRPRVAAIANEAVAISKSGREQIERIGGLLNDAGERAKERLDQIDRSVDNTVEHLEHAGDAMKRAVLRPVREVNGLAAGISAAVSTLVHGARKSSVDHATQDEEMFI